MKDEKIALFEQSLIPRKCGICGKIIWNKRYINVMSIEKELSENIVVGEFINVCIDCTKSAMEKKYE